MALLVVLNALDQSSMRLGLLLGMLDLSLNLDEIRGLVIDSLPRLLQSTLALLDVELGTGVLLTRRRQGVALLRLPSVLSSGPRTYHSVAQLVQLVGCLLNLTRRLVDLVGQVVQPPK